jgi:hypothetical protein
MVANAILESAAGIPNVLHSGGACPAPQRNITRPGRLGGDIEYQMGLYLVVAGPGEQQRPTPAPPPPSCLPCAQQPPLHLACSHGSPPLPTLTARDNDFHLKQLVRQ